MKTFSLVLVIALVLVFSVGSVAEVTSKITTATPRQYKPTIQDQKFINWMLESNEKINSQLEIISDEEANKHYYNVAALCKEFDYGWYGDSVSAKMQPVKDEYGVFLEFLRLTLFCVGNYADRRACYGVQDYKGIDQECRDWMCQMRDCQRSSTNMLEKLLAEVPEPTPTPTSTPKPTPIATPSPTPELHPHPK